MARRAVKVIAHRGASGYLPEHTLAAKALAFGQGADYLEQDVVVAADGTLIVSHDITLDTVTNVADVYPQRRRADGCFYIRDFRLDELRELRVVERRSIGGQDPHYPSRFPGGGGDFLVTTLAAELTMIQGLIRSSGREVGIYPEIKRPEWHRDEGVECGDLLVEALAQHGYRRRDQAVYLQCFHAAELRRLRHDSQCDLPMIQLIGENSWNESSTDYPALLTTAGLAELAHTVDGVGLWIEQLIDRDLPPGPDGLPMPNNLAGNIRRAGLKLHPYTARADDLPSGFPSLAVLLHWLIHTIGVDGIFCDFPDQARLAVDSAPLG